MKENYMSQKSIEPSLFITEPLPESGYKWTLASRLGQMLCLAEDQFGERDLSYTILGVEFSKDGPQIWYPNNCKHIIIQLEPQCLYERYRAYYKLAHECVHLLSPTGGRNANVLEEGLATYFSQQYMHDYFEVNWPLGMESYKIACVLAEILLKLDPYAIKHLRREEPVISKISKELLLKYYPALGEEVASKLAQPFERGA